MAIYNAELLKSARKMLLRTSVEGQGWKIDNFQTGKGGHDSNNPEISQTIDVTLEVLPEKTFGPKPLLPSDSNFSGFVATININLTGSEANGSLSSIMIFAKIISSPIPNDPLIGTVFPYALVNFPLQVKLPSEVKNYTVNVRY